MRGATFRGGKTFTEEEIHDAVVSAVTEFNRIFGTSSESFLVIAELHNSSGYAEKLSVRKDDGSNWVELIQAQARDAESAERFTIYF
jgi:hypothetical protein